MLLLVAMQPLNSDTFKKIALAIDFLAENQKRHPSLEEAAEVASMSAFHFQRVFTDWAGISPKKFMQFITLENAKRILKEQTASLSETAYQTGLSGTGRLHDLFINIEGMTPSEYKNGGQNLYIQYQFTTTIFGEVVIAATSKGICHIGYSESSNEGFQALMDKFPNAKFEQHTFELIERVIHFFTSMQGDIDKPISLHIKGTPFQIKVWQALLQIPTGMLQTYQGLAHTIGESNASRAVGTAIGANPIAYLIPCHRVIKSTGLFGEYRWDAKRKQAILGYEIMQHNPLAKPTEFSLF